jgi:hypothetical protein
MIEDFVAPVSLRETAIPVGTSHEEKEWLFTR